MRLWRPTQPWYGAPRKTLISTLKIFPTWPKLRLPCPHVSASLTLSRRVSATSLHQDTSEPVCSTGSTGSSAARVLPDGGEGEGALLGEEAAVTDTVLDAKHCRSPHCADRERCHCGVPWHRSEGCPLSDHFCPELLLRSAEQEKHGL